MESEIVHIEINNKVDGIRSKIDVERITPNTYRTLINEIVDARLTYKTEFETIQSENGLYEVSKVYKNSEFIVRIFQLTSQFKDSEYRLLGDEIMKVGGFWQVDFGSIAT